MKKTESPRRFVFCAVLMLLMTGCKKEQEKEIVPEAADTLKTEPNYPKFFKLENNTNHELGLYSSKISPEGAVIFEANDDDVFYDGDILVYVSAKNEQTCMYRYMKDPNSYILSRPIFDKNGNISIIANPFELGGMDIAYCSASWKSSGRDSWTMLPAGYYYEAPDVHLALNGEVHYLAGDNEPTHNPVAHIGRYDGNFQIDKQKLVPGYEMITMMAIGTNRIAALLKTDDDKYGMQIYDEELKYLRSIDVAAHIQGRWEMMPVSDHGYQNNGLYFFNIDTTAHTMTVNKWDAEGTFLWKKSVTLEENLKGFTIGPASGGGFVMFRVTKYLDSEMVFVYSAEADLVKEYKVKLKGSSEISFVSAVRQLDNGTVVIAGKGIENNQGYIPDYRLFVARYK